MSFFLPPKEFSSTAINLGEAAKASCSHRIVSLDKPSRRQPWKRMRGPWSDSPSFWCFLHTWAPCRDHSLDSVSKHMHAILLFCSRSFFSLPTPLILAFHPLLPSFLPSLPPSFLLSCLPSLSHVSPKGQWLIAFPYMGSSSALRICKYSPGFVPWSFPSGPVKAA